MYLIIIFYKLLLKYFLLSKYNLINLIFNNKEILKIIYNIYFKYIILNILNINIFYNI